MSSTGESFLKRLPAYESTEERAVRVQGNASVEVKQHVLAMLNIFMSKGKGFADSVGSRIQVAEVDIRPKDDEPKKLEGRVVCEVVVEEG
jgi:acyl-coenzyme A thioesterase 13